MLLCLLGDESKIRAIFKLSYRIVSLNGAWKRMCFNSTCCSAYWGSIQASRNTQTELQNCLAYWGVKAHIFHSACCFASWGMNPRFKRYSNWAIELFRLLGRESLCVAIVQVALLIEDQSKLQEIFKLSYRIVSLIGAWRLIYFIVHVALLLGRWMQEAPKGPKSYSEILFGNLIPISYSEILFRNPIPKSYGEILLQTSL